MRGHAWAFALHAPVLFSEEVDYDTQNRTAGGCNIFMLKKKLFTKEIS